MPDVFSTYEAKTRFAEIIRRVRAGRRVIVSYRGQPVAEIAPIAPAARSLAESLADLTRQGVLTGPASGHHRGERQFRAGPPRKGALKRFLASRD